MTQNLTKREAPARSTRASVRTEVRARTVATHALVDLVRAAASRMVTGNEDEREIAIGLVEQHFLIVSETCPVSEDLRPWQLLASDLAAALLPVDAARAERARTLADEIRATVVIIARNPVEELAIRPASRRVLLALSSAHGREDLSALRENCELSAPNLSNLLKPLRAHGLVKIEDGSEDRRSKVVVLTQKGRDAIAALGKPAAAPAQSYPRYIKRTDPVAAEGAYSLACEPR